MLKRLTLLTAIILSILPVTAQQKDSLPKAVVQPDKAYLLFKGDTLFALYTSAPNITLQERATLIENRLNAIAAQPAFNEKELKIMTDSSKTVYRINYGNSTLVFLSEKDAALNNKTLAELSANYADIFKDKMLAYFAFNSAENISLSVLESAGILLILFLFILLVNKGYKLLIKKVVGKQLLKPLKINHYQLFSRTQMTGILTRLISLVRWVFVILVIYLALPLIFSLFPWTKGIAKILLSFILRPIFSVAHSFVRYLPNLFTILVIYILTRYLVRAIKYFMIEIERGTLTIKGFYADWAMPTFKIVKALAYIFMFIAIFPYLPGSESKIFQGVSVFIGVLFSLGSSSAISNVVSGVVITYMRPFKVGDRVKIADQTGDVVEKNLLVTRIKTIKNEEITIPNATILAGGTTNYSTLAANDALILHTTVTIGYDVPWRQVHQLLLNAAKAVPATEQTPVPFVLQTSLDDYYVSYQLNVYTHESHGMAGMYSLIHQHIQDEFNNAGVEIMSPAYHALRDGNTVTIPPHKRPENYKPDGFIFKES